jgi:outer membrane lipoprotein-sorting protein
VPASRSLALLAVVAGFVSGCGSSSSNSATKFTGAQKDVASAVEDFETAARKSDEGQICTNLLASSLIDSLRSASGETCNKAVNNALDDADSYDLTVKSVNVSGNTATAVVDSKNKATNDTLKLVKEGGRWKIASL